MNCLSFLITAPATLREAVKRADRWIIATTSPWRISRVAMTPMPWQDSSCPMYTCKIKNNKIQYKHSLTPHALLFISMPLSVHHVLKSLISKSFAGNFVGLNFVVMPVNWMKFFFIRLLTPELKAPACLFSHGRFEPCRLSFNYHNRCMRYIKVRIVKQFQGGYAFDLLNIVQSINKRGGIPFPAQLH